MFGLLAPKVNANPSPNAREPTLSGRRTGMTTPRTSKPRSTPPWRTVQDARSSWKGTYYTAQLPCTGSKAASSGWVSNGPPSKRFRTCRLPRPNTTLTQSRFGRDCLGRRILGRTYRPSWRIVRIFGMTLTDPYTAPTMGWDLLGTPYTSLYAAIVLPARSKPLPRLTT